MSWGVDVHQQELQVLAGLSQRLRQQKQGSDNYSITVTGEPHRSSLSEMEGAQCQISAQILGQTSEHLGVGFEMG